MGHLCDHRLVESNFQRKKNILFGPYRSRTRQQLFNAQSFPKNRWVTAMEGESVAFAADIWFGLADFSFGLKRFRESATFPMHSFSFSTADLQWWAVFSVDSTVNVFRRLLEPLQNSPTQIKLSRFIVVGRPDGRLNVVEIKVNELKFQLNRKPEKRRSYFCHITVTFFNFFPVRERERERERHTQLNCRMQLVTVWRSPWNSSSTLMTFRIRSISFSRSPLDLWH